MTYDAVIVGGGLNGCALALALAQTGHHVALVDRLTAQNRAGDQFDGRGYALNAASVNVLKTLGLWDAVAERAQPIHEVKVTDGRAGSPPSPFVLEMQDSALSKGPLGQMVEDRVLRPVLIAALDHPGITAIDGDVTAQTITPTQATVTLADATQINARLLIGSDGRQSGTARRAGINRVTRDYGQTALVCAIAHERPHGGVAHQFFMPAGPLAILPLKGNVSSIVWSEERSRAEAIQARDDAGYLDALRPRFGDFLGEISLSGKRFSYPLLLSVAYRFTADRVALVGDAAHAMHPIAGQGLNTGLKDVAALAQVLTEARRRGEDIGRPEVLDRYQQWRRFDATAMAFAMDGFNRVFSNDFGPLRLARDLGMGLVNALPGAKQRFAQAAAGMAGDLPALAQGRAI